jgi:D-alanyl-D-alanine endopeptidase (penicillin-binding protein 7)
MPPAWLGETSELLAISQLDGAIARRDGERGPEVRSRSALVMDLDLGEVLYERNADNMRPVASITKLVSALALVRAGADLDTSFCVDKRQYPSRSGARSRLSTGDCLAGWDVLGAALVASDNRAAYALAAVAGLDVDEFVAEMNAVSGDLGMSRSAWSDPSGLEDENLSTARDIARATIAVASHPILSAAASAPFWDLHRENGAGPRRVFSTDRLVAREDLLVEAAKTGYTDTARYCFTTVVQTAGGHRLVITLLGAEGKMTRWADTERIMRWVDARG